VAARQGQGWHHQRPAYSSIGSKFIMTLHPLARRASATLSMLVALMVGLHLAPASVAQTPAPAPKPAAAPVVKPAPKPAPKPAAKAAEPASKAVAGEKSMNATGLAADGTANEPRKGMLAKEDLRICLNDEAAVRKRIADAEAARTPMETEKQAIAAEQQAYRDERVTLEANQKAATEGLNAKFKAFATRVEALNARVAAFNENRRSGSAAEKARTEMNKERADLDAERPGLESDRAGVLARLQEAVLAYNAKAAVVDKRVQEWNVRNAKLNDDAAALETDRKDWVSNCANRRYREDDEIAIKAGR